MAIKGIKISIDTIGDKSLLRKLLTLEKKVIVKANRQAMRAAMTPVAKAVRTNIPVDEGDLKKATSSKVYGKGLNVGGVIGADAGYRRVDEDGIEKLPYKYDHLVNDGHINEDGTFTPPNGYMSRAAAEALPKAEARYVEKLTQYVEKEAMKP